MGEAAAFPASARAVLRWLPGSQRGFGQGIQYAGSRLGAAITPALVVFLLYKTTWRWIFCGFGSVGAVLGLVWYAYYRNRPQEHPGVNDEELKAIGPAAAPRATTARDVPWRRILHGRNLWFLSSMYFCYGWVAWMYLFWLPTYLVEAGHFSQIRMGLGASLPLLAATVTNVAGGWTSGKLSSRWSDLRRGRLALSVIGITIVGAGLFPGVVAQNASTGWISAVILADRCPAS